MHISRSESHQHIKKRKARRMRRLLLLNLSMLVAICIIIGVYLMVNHDKQPRLEGASGSGGKEPTNQNAETLGYENADGNGSGENGRSGSADPDEAADGAGSDNSVSSGDSAVGSDAAAGSSGGTESAGSVTTPSGAVEEPPADPPGGKPAGSSTGNGSPGQSDEGSSAGSGSSGPSGTDSSMGGGSSGPSGTDSSTGSGSQNPSGTGSSTGSDAPDQSGGGSADDGRTITLGFVGDILLAGSVDKLMQSSGYDYPYAKSLSFLTEPELMAGNLETPITTRGVPAEDKQYVFKGSPKSLPALKEAGFDLVNLANNHTLDQGKEGLLDTIGHLEEAGMPNIGAGNNETEAYAPVYLEAGGISVAYIGLTRVVPEASWKATSDHAGLAETYDSTRGVKAIQEAKKHADLVVVMVHWGIERSDNPNADQKLLAHTYIDAGADLVIGSHPHVLQGFETYKGKWISYSLGNYIFNMTATDKTKDTGVLNAFCTGSGDCTLKFNPMRGVASQPTPLEGEEAQALLKRLSGISLNASINSEGYVSAK